MESVNWDDISINDIYSRATQEVDDAFSSAEGNFENEYGSGKLYCFEDPVVTDRCSILGNICYDFELNSSCVYHVESACPRGYYCPDESTIIQCPKGYYCGWASTHPIACSWGRATCPHVKMTSPYSAIMFILFLSFLIVCLGLVKVYCYYSLKWIREKYDAVTKAGLLETEQKTGRKNVK
jgi:hypothetical protein